MTMNTMWKERHPLHPDFDGLNRCLHDDWFLLGHELELHRAHARTLERAAILSREETAALLEALDAMAAEFQDAPCPHSAAEDLHTWVEGQLTERAGDAGRRIHTARSRNDQVATLLQMFAIKAGETLAGDLEALVIMACQHARDWSAVVIPLQTHNQVFIIK